MLMTPLYFLLDIHILWIFLVTLQEYEKQLRQKVNKEKSFFYLHKNVVAGIAQQVEQSIGMRKGVFPMKYLGCPITHGRKRKEHYSEFLNRVKGRIQAWKGKMLSDGGKEDLLSSVLQRTPIHTLSTITPPMCVIKELHRIFSRIFLE